LSARLIAINLIFSLKNRVLSLVTKDLHWVTKITFHSVTFRYKII